MAKWDFWHFIIRIQNFLDNFIYQFTFTYLLNKNYYLFININISFENYLYGFMGSREPVNYNGLHIQY